MPRLLKAMSATARLGLEFVIRPDYEFLVLANDSMSANQSSKGDIRRALDTAVRDSAFPQSEGQHGRPPRPGLRLKQ